jgi:hypothetical protein
MGPNVTYQHSLVFDEHTLKTLNQAVTDIRDVLEARGLFYDGLKTDAFHRHLASTLVDLTDAGVTDRKELCSRALNLIFHLKPPH